MDATLLPPIWYQSLGPQLQQIIPNDHASLSRAEYDSLTTEERNAIRIAASQLFHPHYNGYMLCDYVFATDSSKANRVMLAPITEFRSEDVYNLAAGSLLTFDTAFTRSKAAQKSRQLPADQQVSSQQLSFAASQQSSPSSTQQPSPSSSRGSSRPKKISTQPRATTTKTLARPCNAFILYRKEQHAGLVSANPGMHNNRISEMLGKTWKALDPTIKAKYKAQAEKLKADFMLANPHYKYAPRKPSEKKRRMTKKKAAAIAALAASVETESTTQCSLKEQMQLPVTDLALPYNDYTNLTAEFNETSESMFAEATAYKLLQFNAEVDFTQLGGSWCSDRTASLPLTDDASFASSLAIHNRSSYGFDTEPDLPAMNFSNEIFEAQKEDNMHIPWDQYLDYDLGGLSADTTEWGAVPQWKPIYPFEEADFADFSQELH